MSFMVGPKNSGETACVVRADGASEMASLLYICQRCLAWSETPHPAPCERVVETLHGTFVVCGGTYVREGEKL